MENKMFCFQCEEAINGKGCTIEGVCGKNHTVATLQDLLIYTLKGISVYAVKAREFGVNNERVNRFIAEALFSALTNVNFDADRFEALIKEAFKVRNIIKSEFLSA